MTGQATPLLEYIGNAECLRVVVIHITVHLLSESFSCQWSVQLKKSARQICKSQRVSKLSLIVYVYSLVSSANSLTVILEETQAKVSFYKYYKKINKTGLKTLP
jgi:hypothetical protein